jgi:hypothetical protein
VGDRLIYEEMSHTICKVFLLNRMSVGKYRKQNSQMLIMLIGCPPFPHTITMCCTAFNIAKIDTTELLLKVALYGWARG